MPLCTLGGVPIDLFGTVPPIVVPPGPMSQVFTLTNWGSATSLGQHKRGVWFRKGDVPAGSIPALSSGTMQLYGLRYWKDGSLKYARLLLRDATLAASASRSYTMTAVTGTMAAGSTAAIGNAGLAAALTGHDVKVAFANVQTWDCSSTNGNYAALGSGSFTASLAAHASLTTRWTLLTTGSVADVWQGWGMATDNTGGAADAHLKVNWYVTRWKNADGSTLGFQIGAVVSLDWWSVANKFFLQYDATLLDGSTSVAAYTGVKHQYQSQWILCVNDGGLNAGTAPWIGATQPTLHCSFDRDYAVAAGVVPPCDTAKRPTPAPQYAYVPCGVVADVDQSAHPNSHRPAIDAAGGYQGRGVITRFDADAFMAGTPQAYTVARLNALSGLGVPYHYRSNRTRTRPGESADVANTIIPLIMRPKATSYSDFTAQGLPIAVDAYTANGTPGSACDGFVWQNGLQNSAVSGQPYKNDLSAMPAGVMGPWQPSIDTSHAVSYCYFMALVSGDEWLLEAQIDLAMNMAHQGIWGYHNNVQSFAITWNSATPASYWTGLMAQFQADAIRALGWAQLTPGHACGLTPADHPAYGYLQAAMVHNGDYIETNLDYLPPNFAAAPFYSPESQLGLNSLYSPWMNNFIACCAYMHFLLNEDTRWQRLGDYTATWAIQQAGAGRWYALDVYRTLHRAKRAAWDATANPELPALQQPTLDMTASYVASTNTFTASGGALWSEESYDPPTLTNGDLFILTTATDGGSAGVLPAGATEGQIAYLVNLGAGRLQHGAASGQPTFQLSATMGGAPISFSADTANCNLAFLPQSVAIPQVASSNSGNFLLFPYLPNWGDYVPVGVSVLMMARQTGNPACTAQMRDGALAFTAPMDGESGANYYSAFDMATSA